MLTRMDIGMLNNACAQAFFFHISNHICMDVTASVLGK